MWAIRGLSITERAVLLYMAHRAEKNTGILWHKQTTLAKDLEISRQAVNRAINGLVGAGYVEILDRHSHNNTYRLVKRDVTEGDITCNTEGQQVSFSLTRDVTEGDMTIEPYNEPYNELSLSNQGERENESIESSSDPGQDAEGQTDRRSFRAALDRAREGGNGT